MTLWYRFWWIILQPLAWVFFGLSVKGLEHIPKKGAVVLACNHSSFFDPPIIALSLRRQVFYLARQSLFKNRLFGALIHSFGARPVSRSSAKGMKSALQLLQEEKAMLVFPEGTRTLDGRLQEVKTGAAWLSIKAGCPIVPVWINGAYQSYPKGQKIPKPHKVNVSVCEPIYPNLSEQADKESQIKTITKSLQFALQSQEHYFLESHHIPPN